ncbi:hypothetical protein V8B97DRAFT_2025517 [Scleroderma yunnanense]
MEDTRYPFTDPFLNHSTDNFSFSQPSSSHLFPPQNSWEEPLELSGGTTCNANPFEDIDWNNADIQAFLKEALDMTPSAPGGDMTPYHRFTFLPHASVILPPVSVVLTPPANQLPCPEPHFSPPSSPLLVPTLMSNMSPPSETQFQSLPSKLKNPSLPTSCTTDVSSSHGTMDTLTAGFSLHLLSVAQDITGISQAANNSSWCTHNPGCLALPIHHSEPLTDEWKQKEATLSESVKKLAEELSQKIAGIAQEHSITVEKFSKLLTGHINYKKLSLEVNAAYPPGSKYSLIQLHQMVAEDPSLQNLDNEAKAQLKDNATWYSTDNAMNFWEDVLKLEPDQVMKQFELWGCSQNKNITQWESLKNMQRECMQLIETSFHMSAFTCWLVGNQTWLNYNNFDSTIKLKHGIDKKGWPEAVPFTSPCSIPNIELIHQLQDMLRANQCYFVKMSSWEHQDFMKDLKVHQESGEIVKPSCKKCSDARTKNGRATKSCKYVSSTEEETEDSNEEGMDK